MRAFDAKRCSSHRGEGQGEEEVLEVRRGELFARTLSPVVAVLLLLLTACGGRGDLYTARYTPLPAISTATALVHVVPQTNAALVLRPGERQPGALPLSPGARRVTRIPGTEALLVLTGTARKPTVDVVDVAANKVTPLALPGFFDVMTPSPDGQYVVFTYDAAARTGPLVARNLNEVALFTVASRAVVRLQLDTESLAPRGVHFAPPDAQRQLVAVALERGVAVFDARHPEAGVRRITIRPPGTDSESSVLEAVFSPDARWLFLRASLLDDVIVIELGPEVGTPVSASINFVSGGRGLTDLEPAPAAFPDAVLAAFSVSRELWLLDARGIVDNSRRLLATEPVSELKVLSGAQVLAWDGRGGKGVTAWNLNDGRSGTSVMDQAATSPLLVPAMGKALFFHGSALSAVTLSDETNRIRLRLQSIQLVRSAATSAVDAATQRLFFAVSGSPNVVTLELSTLRLSELPLDAAPERLHHLAEGDWLVSEAAAGTFQGDVTMWPAGDVDRTRAVRFTDYFFHGELDRAEDF